PVNRPEPDCALSRTARLAGSGRRAAKTSRHTLRHFISCRPSFGTFRKDLESAINKARMFLGGRGDIGPGFDRSLTRLGPIPQGGDTSRAPGFSASSQKYSFLVPNMPKMLPLCHQ